MRRAQRGASRPLLLAAALMLLLAGCSSTVDDPADADRPSAQGREERQRPGAEEPRHRDAHRPSREPAADPAELAARLTAAEDLARDPGTAPALRQAAALEAQLLYRQLGRTPAWERTVRAAVPARYRADLDDHLAARHALRSVLSTLSDEVPAWEIREPEPTADLLRFYREGERTYGVPWQVLAAVNFVETGFGKIHGLSTAGAQGPMQFIPATWEAYGEGDVNDPHDAILAAARYLAANDGGSPAGIEDALYHYNNHQGYVAGVLAYARIIERDPRALGELVRWQIIYLSTIGDVWLPVGYHESAPVPVREYVRRHPGRHLGTSTD